MKQAISILLDYLTCTNPVMVTKWQNLLASFWHKDEGKVVKSITQNGDGTTITTTDGSGNDEATNIPTYTEPPSFEISKINGLSDALSGKVDKEVGKGLSTEDFTTALKGKLISLYNYVPPATQNIGYIDGLQAALDSLGDEIQILNETISGLASIQFLYWRGYRLYKKTGNTNIWPEIGDELQGRGDGTFYAGEYIVAEVKTEMPDGHTPVNADLEEPIIRSV